MKRIKIALLAITAATSAIFIKKKIAGWSLIRQAKGLLNELGEADDSYDPAEISRLLDELGAAHNLLDEFICPGRRNNWQQAKAAELLHDICEIYPLEWRPQPTQLAA